MIKYDIILKGKNEFYPNLNNKQYNVLKVDTKEKQDFMSDIINKFILSQSKNHTEKHYIAIDYEFNKVSKDKKDIALMQLCLENDSNVSYIFILLPSILSKDNMNILIQLMTNTMIYKILHGSESLDIPYIYNQLLITKDKIDKFCVNFYDTKYLCEYNMIENNITTKCSIYDLLLNQKVVTQKKIDELNRIEDKMGPIYMIQIDIHNLSNYVLYYALYDVIFLPELLKKFLNRSEIYRKTIPEISCIINSYKRNIDPMFGFIETLINSMNIYFIRKDNNRILLKDLFNKVVLHKLTQINYFKRFIIILYKLIFYNNVLKNNIVYKNSNEQVKKDELDKYIEWIKQYKYIYNIITS